MGNKHGSSNYSHGDAGGSYGDYAHGFDFNAFLSDKSNYSHIGVKGAKKGRTKRPRNTRGANQDHSANKAYMKKARRGMKY